MPRCEWDPRQQNPRACLAFNAGDVKHESDAAEKVAFMSTKAIIKDTLIDFIPF